MSGGTASLRISKFLEIVNYSLVNMPFTCKQTNPEAIFQPPPLLVLTVWAIVICSNHPSVRFQIVTTSLYQDLLKLFSSLILNLQKLKIEKKIL